MKTLGDATEGAVASARSQWKAGLTNERSGKLLAIRRKTSMPPVANKETDVTIPRMVLSAWKETGKPRCLRRALTATEREKVEERRDELEPWVVGYHEAETTDVHLAIAELYSAFPSMRAVNKTDAMSRCVAAAQTLAQFPMWAIERRCTKIRENGYIIKRDGLYITERHWPPSDPEIVEQVREEASLYADTYRNMTEMLMAEVER